MYTCMSMLHLLVPFRRRRDSSFLWHYMHFSFCLNSLFLNRSLSALSPPPPIPKVLHLYVSELVTDEPWHMTEVILGLSKSTNQSSPKKTKGLASLQKLIVGHINWYSMGFHLMEGAFERLVEVRGIAVDYIPAGEEEYDDYLIDDVPDWYNVNVETLNLWCDLFRCRNIRYGNAICFTLSLEAPPPSHDLVCRLLGYLAQPIGLKILSNIDTLELDKVWKAEQKNQDLDWKKLKCLPVTRTSLPSFDGN